MKTLILFFILSNHLMAQSLNGEYRLQGIPELASAFMFTKDGNFEFFFIYGAVDRSASGKYSIEGNKLKLTGEKEPGKDFPVISESKKGNHYTIKVTDPNAYLLRNIVCLYYIDSTENATFSDDDGMIRIDVPHVDKIFLVHELFPDVPSLIKDDKNSNNYFEVTLSPTLGQVSFQNLDFTIDGKTISCLPNPLFPFEKVSFVKQ